MGGLALVAGGALASTTVKGSKSNSGARIDPRDANGAKACTGKGGKILTDSAGDKICLMETPPVPSGTPLRPPGSSGLENFR